MSPVRALLAAAPSISVPVLPALGRRPAMLGWMPPPVSFEEEQELVARAQAGDERAFEVLVRRHADGLYAVVARFLGPGPDAEEATQEAFLRAWRSIDRFRGEARFFTWLYRIGINEAKRRARRGRAGAATTSLEETPDAEVADAAAAPESVAGEVELRRALDEAIRGLKPTYRAALILRDVEGLSTAEAAASMGLGEAAFKSRLHRARRAVRRAVAAYLEEGA